MFEEQLRDGTEVPVEGRLDLRSLCYGLLEKWWLIALCLVLAWTAAILYLAQAQTLYAATAVIKLQNQTPRILGTQDLLAEARNEEERREQRKEIQILLKSPALLLRMIEVNLLSTDPRFTAGTGTNRLDPATLVGRIAPGIRVEPRPGTTFLDVSVEQPDPVLAALLANALVKELIRLNAESFKAVSETTIAYLADEAQELQKRLTECELKLQGYRDQSLTFEQRQQMVADTLKELNQKMNAARADRIRLEAEYLSVKTLVGDVPRLLNVPRIAADPAVVAIRASLAQQEIEFANIRQVYKPKHPTYLQAQARLRELHNALGQTAGQAVETMRIAVTNAADQEQALTAEIGRQEKVAQHLNTQFIPYNTLLRDIEQYRALYDSVIKRMGEATMAGNLDIRTIQVFQEAKPPKSPVKPRRLMVLAGSLLAGLGIGLLLAWGSEGMDDSIRTMNDAEAYLRLPVLSTIPRLGSAKLKRRPLVMTEESRFSGAEAFRALRTSLFLHDPDGRNRSFLFTSTTAGEGKTFTSLNFAASLAQQGFRTLLIDADLRRPMLEKLILGGKKGAPGVINHLKGESITIQSTMVENLFLMPAGPVHSNPAELLARNGLRDVLEESLRQFDRVVLDAAPIFGVSDTLRLVRDVQVVCLVVRARRTPRKQVRRCLQMLERASAPVAGLVLNGVPTSRRSAYDSPYHDYGYDGEPADQPKKTKTTPSVPAGVMNFQSPASPPNRRAAQG